MALDKDILGQAIYDVRVIFSNKTYQQLVTTYGTMEAARLAAAKAEAEVIINHIKTAGVVLPNTFFAPQNAGLITGTGKII
jgi:hypothetical protein